MINLEIYLRIILAIICAAFIGYERAGKSKEAGLKTHIIVALCASTITTASVYGLDDGGRVIGSLISGFGFLGGNIIFFKNGGINGLTTAAGLWTTIAISISFGLGRYDIGVFGTIMLVLIQYILHKDPISLKSTKQRHIELSTKEEFIDSTLDIFKKQEFGFQMSSIDKRDPENCIIEGEVFTKATLSQEELIKIFSETCNSIKIEG